MQKVASLVLLTIALGGPIAAQEPLFGVAGNVEGRLGLSFRPLDVEGKPLPLPGCSVHLIEAGDPDSEMVNACGEWVAPPRGYYRYWMEGSDFISPSHGLLTYSAQPFRGKAPVSARTVVPAGRVMVTASSLGAATDQVRLLHLDSHNQEPYPQPEMSRRVPAGDAGAGTLMPAGGVVAAIFDSSQGEYLAISRPFVVPSGGEVLAAPQPPLSDTTDLLVVLERPRIAKSFDDYEIDLSVVAAEGARRTPDLVIPTAERTYAVWYGLHGRLATLEVASPSAFLPAQEIPLRPGRVENLRRILLPLPDLTVRLELPPQFELDPEAAIEVRTLPERQLVDRRQVVVGSDQRVFQAVPARPLEVILDSPPWRVVERIDLSEGVDRVVTLDPRPLRVSGSVYRGDRGYPATVTFGFWDLREENRHSVETDEDGSYETLLFQPTMVAFVLLRGGAEPLPMLFHRKFENETVLDFHLPANAFSVRVVDATDGEGIPRAEVRVVNVFDETEGGEDVKSVRGYRVDEQGQARLAPVRPGEIWLRAIAGGFRATEFLKLPVGEDDPGNEITLSLTPEEEGAGDSLTILLPSGAPAAGAELLVVESLQFASAPQWKGFADAEGHAELPARLQDHFLLIKHPGAAFTARRLNGGLHSTGETWTLGEPSPVLPVVARRSWGDPAPWARIALRVQGIELSGELLQWVTGSSATNALGFWQGASLPAGPVEVVAWMPAEDVPRDPTALLASFATRIAPPWDRTVEIEAVE